MSYHSLSFFFPSTYLADTLPKISNLKELFRMQAGEVWLDGCLCKWIEGHWSVLFPLAVLYHRWGKLELAEKHYELSLNLDPEAPGTRDNYNMLRRKMDQLKQLTPWGGPQERRPCGVSRFIWIHVVLFYHTHFAFALFVNKEIVPWVRLVLQYFWNRYLKVDIKT